jgi:type IV secretion system protein VirB4
MTNEASVLVDTDASNKAADADLALQELGADYAGIAYVTATVTVWDADPRIADEKLRLVEKVIQGRDFTAMAETINAVDAWLGSLPGHVYANVRQPPISTLNLAHMIPLSAVWAGPERDEHFAAPAAVRQDRRLDPVPAFPSCRRCRPYADRRPDRRGQVGAAGADGLAVPALCRRAGLRLRLRRLDPRGGARHARRLARSRRRADRGQRRQRIAATARPRRRRRARMGADWIGAILARESVAITPEVKEHLWTALTSLASAPVEERTITGLRPLAVQRPQAGAASLLHRRRAGAGCSMPRPNISARRRQAFETEGLIGTEAAPAVLAYLFHRIEDRLDGSPTSSSSMRAGSRSTTRASPASSANG